MNRTVATKSYKAFVTYFLLIIGSMWFLSLIHQRVKNLNLETIFVLSLLYLTVIFCSLSIVIMLYLPKVLIYINGDELIINRRIKKIVITREMLVTVKNEPAYTRLSRRSNSKIEHSFGVLKIQTKTKTYVVIGVANLDAVKTTIMLFKKNGQESIFSD